MKEFGHKSSSSRLPPPPKKKKSSSRGRGGGAHWGERQMAKFLHKSSPGERGFMKEFGHKSSSSRPTPPPNKKKNKVVVVAGVGGPIGEKDQWPNSFIKVVLGKETTFISNFLHISCPGEKDYFYDQFPS